MLIKKFFIRVSTTRGNICSDTICVIASKNAGIHFYFHQYAPLKSIDQFSDLFNRRCIGRAMNRGTAPSTFWKHTLGAHPLIDHHIRRTNKLGIRTSQPNCFLRIMDQIFLKLFRVSQLLKQFWLGFRLLILH